MARMTTKELLKDIREKTDMEFSNIIRERLTEAQFWKWIRSWKDPAVLVEEAENWDTDTKLAELKKLKRVI